MSELVGRREDWLDIGYCALVTEIWPHVLTGAPSIIAVRVIEIVEARVNGGPVAVYPADGLNQLPGRPPRPLSADPKQTDWLGVDYVVDMTVKEDGCADYGWPWRICTHTCDEKGVRALGDALIRAHTFASRIMAAESTGGTAGS